MAVRSKFLILRFDGLLQSWGSHSRWDRRESDSFPTKSGVLGLIGCAMGIPRDGPDPADWASKLQMGIRADKSGSHLWDFHTVTGNPLMTANGTKRSGGDTILTPLEYLNDTVFTVVLGGDDALLEKMAAALQDPVFLVGLGRRSCVPSAPIFVELTDEYASIKEALENYPAVENADLICRLKQNAQAGIRR